MRYVSQHVLMQILLLLAMLATGSFALQQVDCLTPDKNGNFNNACVYYRIGYVGSKSGTGLYVVNEGDPLDPAYAVKNTDFYVAAPETPTDSVICTMIDGGVEIKDKMAVSSGETGIVGVVTKGLYPFNNFRLGNCTDPECQKSVVARVYSFYAPKITFCLDKKCEKEITEEYVSNLGLQVGDTLDAYAVASIPIGPDKGALDDSLEQSFYFKTTGSYDNLVFLNSVGDELKMTPQGYQLNFEKTAYVPFKVVAPKAVSGGTITLNGYPDPQADGDTAYVVSEKFPDGLQFVNPDAAYLDSAFIYDTNGDGKGDSIVAFFSGAVDSINGFKYNWPDDGKCTSYSGDVVGKTGGSVFALTDVKSVATGDSAKGTLVADIYTKVSGQSSESDTEIQDRIGPVINKASLVKGEGKTDTLVLRFNKDIDTSWNEGEGFLINGKPVDMEAIDKQGNIWTFVLESGVVASGDSVQISTSCKKDACPDGLIKAADGNKTGKNNPVVVDDSGRIYTDDENNGFYDMDGNGQMDSATVAFASPLSKSDLKNLEVSLFWLDSKGDVVEIPLTNLDSLVDAGVVVFSEDSTVLGVKVDPKEYDIKEMLTAIDSSYANDGAGYGFAVVTNYDVVDGDTTAHVDTLSMNDRLPPQISSTFLQPESFQKMESDRLVISFSEPVNKDSVDLNKAFLFSENGKDWKPLDVSRVEWNKEGTSVSFLLETGVALDERVNPADHIKLNPDHDGFKDLADNGVFESPMEVMLEGDPRVLTKTSTLASIDYADVLSKNKDFTIRFVPADSSMDTEMKMSLGVLMDIGFATIMDKDSTGESALDLRRIGLTWQLDVFTNLGAYVSSASDDIRCDDRDFGGNCIENAKKLYIRWNMRSAAGRKVGVGVYVAKFKVKVFGAKESFEYERYYKWGVKGGKGSLELKSLDK